MPGPARLCLALAGAAALWACDETPPANPPARQADAAVMPDPRPVMGAERLLAVLPGPGWPPAEDFAGRLEAALRARGVNARVTVVDAAALADPARRPELIVADRLAASPAGMPVLKVDGQGAALDDLVAAVRDRAAAALPPAGSQMDR